MKYILYIANYKGSIGGISGQVQLLHSYVSKEPNFEATIFSTQGNLLKRFYLFFLLLYKARQYEILHIHACSYRGMLPAIFGIIAGKIWGKRIILTYHGGDAAEYFKQSTTFVRRWLCRADEVIVLSGFLKAIFDQYNIPCRIIPNIIELPPVEHMSTFNPVEPKFISMRHLRELYNIPCILRAFEHVQKQIPGAKLTLLGSGPQREELEQYAREKALNTTFVGQVPNTEINSYLASHDIVLSAPRIDNMPVSLLEAMNAGVLVVSSNVGGVPYMIEDDVTGLLFDDNDDEMMAQKMMWAINNPNKMSQIVQAAHAEVQQYSWEKIRKQILALYE